MEANEKRKTSQIWILADWFIKTYIIISIGISHLINIIIFNIQKMGTKNVGNVKEKSWDSQI